MEDVNIKKVLNQMKKGSRLKITVKLKGKNQTFIIPLKGFRELYK